MIDIEVKIHQPTGYDVRVWNLPLDNNGEHLGRKPKLLDVIFCRTKREANKTKKTLLADKEQLAQYKQKGDAWSPTHTIPVHFLEDRNGRALVRLPNGSKTSIEYGDMNGQNIFPMRNS